MKIAKVVGIIAAAFVALAGLNTAAAQSADHSAHASATPVVNSAVAAVAGQAQAMSVGEIKKVDKETGRLTIKHGPLENLSMPGMTMVFAVRDASVLDKAKVGDKIKFVAEKLEGRFVVTQLDIQK
jgi:Cu(I)/Ag(I) efflux system protein CusF